MSSPAPKPLAPGYSSSILHVLEAYRGLKKRLSDTEAQLAQETSCRQRQAESFEALASEWMAREAQYRAQIERMGSEVAHGGDPSHPPNVTSSEAFWHSSQNSIRRVQLT